MTTIAKTNPNNALMRLGDQQIACRVEGGFIVRASRKLRLFFGPELYAACKGTPGMGEKVSMYQPGYMKLIAAMGGTLTVPPTVRDPVTGKPMANPVVEFVPGTSVIRSVRATAVCVARDVMGVYHASVQTITVDAEHVLRQAMLGVDRSELVQILSDADVQADREKGGLRGWVVIPFMPGYSIVGDLKAQPIRDALKTYNNLSATIRQRACTKAERLACDHNPVSRMTWLYGELLQDLRNKKTGEVLTSAVADGVAEGWVVVSPPYAEIDVTAWTESRGQEAMAAFVESLASQQQVEGVESVVVGEIADTEESDIDDDPEEVPATRQIAENSIPPVVIPPKPGPVPVVAPKVEAPTPAVQAAAQPVAQESSPEVLKLQERCAALVGQLPPGEVSFARTKSGFGTQEISACVDMRALRALQVELSECLRALK